MEELTVQRGEPNSAEPKGAAGGRGGVDRRAHGGRDRREPATARPGTSTGRAGAGIGYVGTCRDRLRAADRLKRGRDCAAGMGAHAVEGRNMTNMPEEAYCCDAGRE